MNDVIKIEEDRYNKGLICKEELNNFKICIKNFDINTEKINEIEEKLYHNICSNELERKGIIYKTFQKVTESIVNEMVYRDIKLLTDDTPGVTINMDSLYNTHLNHLKMTNNITNRILPKSQEKIRNNIIKVNIIITSLFRYKNIFIYNRLKDDMNFELKEKIRFTKGYMVCIEPNTVKIMQEYSYYKKTISNKRIEIKTDNYVMKIREYLKNEKYSNPIGIKEDNISEIKSNINIMNNCLDEEINTEDFIENINFLNKIELTINKETLENVYDFIEKKVDTNNMYITKNKLIENIYKINEREDSITIGENFENNDFVKLSNSASMLEIIKKQLENFDSFYINNAYDSRLRIYAQTGPVNYQLNHIVRSCIIIKNEIYLKEILNKFDNHPIVKENYKKCKDSLLLKIEKEVENKYEKFLKSNMNGDKENYEIKKECLLMVLNRLSPSNIKDLNSKIKFAIDNYHEFINDNLIENGDKGSKKLQLKKIKMPYLISLKECLNKIKNDKFCETYGLDASSNAIQLIALRMGCRNKKLLMLTNIIDNKTEYENIYEYVTSKIKEENHDIITEKIKKLSKKDIDSLRDKDDSKYLIMPACYGMGKYKNRINVNEKLKNSEIWQRLDKKEKNKISDYFGEKTFEILKDIEFDLEQYKKICNSLKKYDAFMGKNDVGLTVAPINTLKSKRQEILKKLNELNMKKEQNTNKEKIEKKIEELKDKIKKDEKMFGKRTMVKIIRDKKEINIYVRIPNIEKILDKRMTLQALTPNTIHAYDASIMFLCIKICKEIGIEILVIHDCIGCKLIHAPIVKKIFKIANIAILKRKNIEKPFPMKDFYIEDEYLNKLAEEILESTNFFR